MNSVTSHIRYPTEKNNTPNTAAITKSTPKMTNTIMVMFLMQQKYKNNQYDESDDNRNFAAVSRLKLKVES
jgi:hypothetical protein